MVEIPCRWSYGLGWLTVQAHCLSGYSHYPPPQPLAQFSLSCSFRVILATFPGHLPLHFLDHIRDPLNCVKKCPLLQVVQRSLCGQENGAGDSLGTRLPTSFMGNMGKYHPGYFG